MKTPRHKKRSDKIGEGRFAFEFFMLSGVFVSREEFYAEIL
jgi:hypothetical protein